MQGMMLDGNREGKTPFARISLAGRESDYDEKWLQRLLFENPSLLPIAEIDNGAREFVPICRELSIPKAGGAVFLDIFGVTPEGHPVLVECKLWRNPQARREVIAQVLEYAGLMRRWSYGDLAARIRGPNPRASANPLYARVAEVFPGTDEASFVDRVSDALRTGDFVLIIAGDGIRSDVRAIVDQLTTSSGLTATLALVEFQLWRSNAGDLMVLPALPLRTEIIRHRVFLDDSGLPVSFESEGRAEDDAETLIDPDRDAFKQATRAFWQSFIDTVRFDHPDQAKPRHGGHGWVRLAMPSPARWMTAFRAKTGDAGLFMRFYDEEGLSAYVEIEAAREQLEIDCGLPIRMTVERENPFNGLISFDYTGDPANDDAFKAWLIQASNAVVNTFRPFLNQLPKIVEVPGEPRDG